MAVSEAPVFEQFLPRSFDFPSMSMRDMVFLLGMLVVLCCVSWLVWRLHGFLRHNSTLTARTVISWHNISRARAAFRSSSGVASSEFDNWVLLDSGASVTIISETFLAKCCTVIRRGRSNSPVSISTATSESLVVDEEVSCILHCHEQRGKLTGVHLKGYVSDRVPLTLISTGVLGAGGWKIGNKGPLMTLVYQGTRLVTHLFANCSWVYAIDSREDYAIETMKDLGMTIPPNFGSPSLVPVSLSSRPEAQSASTTATVVKPLSSSAKVNKPASNPEASQAQATINQCQCECEGCLIGNCPKDIKKRGLNPELPPGCICKAVIYQTCFVPSTCAVKFREWFCNSLNMFQDGMCTCHDMFLSNLSRALSNLMLCLTCLACWLSRVVSRQVVSGQRKGTPQLFLLKILGFLILASCFEDGGDRCFACTISAGGASKSAHPEKGVECAFALCPGEDWGQGKSQGQSKDQRQGKSQEDKERKGQSKGLEQKARKEAGKKVQKTSCDRGRPLCPRPGAGSSQGGLRSTEEGSCAED